MMAQDLSEGDYIRVGDAVRRVAQVIHVDDVSIHLDDHSTLTLASDEEVETI